MFWLVPLEPRETPGVFKVSQSGVGPAAADVAVAAAAAPRAVVMVVAKVVPLLLQCRVAAKCRFV